MTEQLDKPAAHDANPITPTEPRPAHLPPPVQPERTYERGLVDMWQAELGFGPIGIDDDFFELDGDSFTALNILTAFEQSTGIELSPSLLIDNPTIRALAALAREAKAADNSAGLITIHDSGSPAPVYFIPGAGGEALNGRPLAMALGDDIPFHGVPNINAATQAGTEASVEGIADWITAAIRKANSDGPYILAGYCVGAIFAYEVAQRLRGAGADVPLLIMIDAVNRAGIGWGAGLAAGLRSLRQHLRRQGQSIMSRTPGPGSARQHQEPNSPIISGAYDRYRPRPYGGRVILYASEENTAQLASPDLGWAKLVGAGLEVVELPTPHHLLSKPESIQAFSGDLRRRIVAARPAA